MTLGVSNFSTPNNGALASSGLSQDGTIAAQNFLNVLLGQDEAPRSGGQAFLADVKETPDPDEKRALIDGFAEGFAAASEGGSAEAGRASATATEATSSATAVDESTEADTSPQALMSGFQEIADRVAESALPKSAKNTLLDGIATLMSQLKAEAPAGQGSESASPVPASERTSEPALGSDSTSSANTGPWSHEVKDGEATINLGDKYTIKANEKDATWTVTNNETGKSTKVWGDPHADTNNDGKTDFDFKKDMTFKLDDGTKITVGTVPGGENGTTYSSTLTITNGQNAMQVKGLGDTHDGQNNLEVTQSMEGETVDSLESDGSNTIYENGGAWQTGGNNIVDQAYIDRAEAMVG